MRRNSPNLQPANELRLSCSPWGRGESLGVWNPFIYTFEPLPCGIDELEDTLDSALGDRGEFTGTGTGRAGCNIDVFITDGAMSEEQALLLIRRALADHGLPGMTRVVIDGKEHTLA